MRNEKLRRSGLAMDEGETVLERKLAKRYLGYKEWDQASMTAEQLAAKLRENALKLVQTGGYSVEAETLMRIATDLADLADKVAALEGLARTDIGQIVDGILEGRYRPPPVNEKRPSLPLAGEEGQ